MQLILLSGGSGKRLWPLSNNSRSKQFLPLLSKEDGTMESMVQRVIRQIDEANLTKDITIATNSTQLDIITNQLGDRVSIVTEPERRDTFPAIALASSYLKFSKHCSENEIVVIMPCDPYTETGYFEAITKMVNCVEQGVADLVLMGITPTYPSEKYGYIVPNLENSNSLEGYHLVKNFTEKPNSDKAQELLNMGAYWNGGVFAFRLGYITEIVNRYVNYDSFEDIRNHYSDLPKLSFDYEVVEKANSVAVVPFKGKWKDLGTWNILTEELHPHTIGNAILGQNCYNTHVVNELQYPIYVDGLNDAIVAACPDGILVCGKQYSENIKYAVDSLMLRPMYEERRWGTYQVLENSTYADGHQSLTKVVKLKPGKNISYQRHHHRSEVWTFVEGEGVFVLDGVERHVKVGDTLVIPIGHCHAIKAITHLTFIEVQSGCPLVEEDVERFDWEWGNDNRI